MGTRLYIGSLSFDTSDEGLRNLFAGAGTVHSAEVARDRDTGSSKGFGFVEMGSEAEAKKAIGLFNGTTLDNRSIRVDEARPREAGRGGGFVPGRNGGGSRNRW